MTRLAVSAALLLSALTTHAAHAQDVPDDDTVSAATEAGVNPTDVLGALNTLHAAGYAVDAHTYLFPPPTTVMPVAASISGVWSRLAQCESNGRWNANTGNGYYGGLQEDMTFWVNYGGRAYAARPDLASPSAQVAVAARGQARQGWGAWPVCSRRVGLR